MRGKHASTPIEQLVENAKGLAAKGVKELILIAQDLTYYGLDLYKKRNLDELVAKLSDVEGIEWIRLHYAFPSGFPVEVLEVMRERENVCNYLDMPLQHGSTNMLKRMRRGITQERTEALVSTIRERVPGIAIRTTLIAGFPGETQLDHEDNLKWIERMRFDRLGAFTYSHEEDTHAHTMEDDVPGEVKQQRALEIMELQGGISSELNQAKLGKVFRVLVDKAEAGHYIARTEFDSPDVDNEVLIPTKENYLRIGDFAQVRITEAREHELIAEPIEAIN
jgi:ribosomal protein S12 methylthiotransferase